MKNLYKRFEPWDITEESFKIDVFRYDNKSGVTVDLMEYDVKVSSYSEKNQRGNLVRCLEIIETILLNYML
ncbi:MAG: hypothetical protein ACRDA4_08085 [Filifactoraceae bacterium]